MANRKMYKYWTVFVLALIVNMLSISFCSLAEKHYILYNGEIEVVMPDDYLTVTRADLRNAVFFKQYGLEDETAVLEYMESQDIYLDAIDSKGDYEICISVKESEESLDYTSMDDASFFDLKDALVEEMEKRSNSSHMEAISYIVNGVRYLQFNYDLNLDESSQERIMYWTVKDGISYVFIYTRLNPKAMMKPSVIDGIIKNVKYKTVSEHVTGGEQGDISEIKTFVDETDVKTATETIAFESAPKEDSKSIEEVSKESQETKEEEQYSDTSHERNVGTIVLIALIVGVVLAGLLRFISTGTTKGNKTSKDKLASSEGLKEKTEKPAETPKILYCKKCGKKLLDGGTFCRFCGTNNVIESTGIIQKQSTGNVTATDNREKKNMTSIAKTQRTVKSNDPFIKALEQMKSSDKEEQAEGRWSMRLLEANDPRAMYWVAQEYEKRGGLRAAANYYEDAFKHGITEAKEGYLRCYNPYHHPTTFDIFEDSRGCGTPFIESERKITEKQKQDFDKAFKVINDSTSTKEDLKKAVQTIYQIATASSCDVPEAQLWLADYYEHVAKDDEQAARWYRAAANHGLAEGARCYADMLMVGKGTEQNPEEAIKYYKIASDKGIPEAQFVMAQYYHKQGKANKAKHLFILSAKGGFAPAREMLASLYPRKETNGEADDSNKLDKTFRELTRKYNLGKSSEKVFPEIYQPDDFCEKAYEYCKKQYAEDPKKMLYEFCMTAFYGCICTVALYKQDKNTFEKAATWDTLYKHINVEFTDSNAERLLGTRQGEEKAENIYKIIKEYIDVAMWTMMQGGYEKSVCLDAMRGAYNLGLLVAENELQE